MVAYEGAYLQSGHLRKVVAMRELTVQGQLSTEVPSILNVNFRYLSFTAVPLFCCSNASLTHAIRV